MKKNRAIYPIITAALIFFALFWAPVTNAQKSDSLQQTRKQIVKKKIYPAPHVKSVISPTPPNYRVPKPKSAISGVSVAGPTEKSSSRSAGGRQKSPLQAMASGNDDFPPYTSTDKIDPFVPLIRESVVKKPPVPKPPFPDPRPKTVLEKIDLSQLKLTAIVIPARGGNRALVEESSGKGHIVVVNTKIGTRGGKVVEIKKDRLIIEERSKDDFGRMIAKKRELVLAPAL